MKEKLIVTKNGATALWECGGATANKGEAQIIAGRNGEDLQPIYLMRPKKAVPNGDHALFIVRNGYYVVRAQRTSQDSYVSRIYEIRHIDRVAYTCEMEEVGAYGNGVWDQAGDLLVAAKPKLLEAVTVSVNKSREANCRRAMYFRKMEEEQQ